MKKIAKFEKVSYNQFKNDFMDSFPQYKLLKFLQVFVYVLKMVGY